MEKGCSKTCPPALVLWLWACWCSACLRCSFPSAGHPCPECRLPHRASCARGYHDSRDEPLRAAVSSWQVRLPACSCVLRAFVCHISGFSMRCQYAACNIRKSGWTLQAYVFFLGISEPHYNWFPRALGAQVPFQNMRLCLSFLICEMGVRALHHTPVCRLH